MNKMMVSIAAAVCLIWCKLRFFCQRDGEDGERDERER